MAAAQGNVFIIGPEHDLGAFPDDAVTVIAGIACRLPAAPAHGLDFLDLIGDGDQSFTAGKEIELEIGAQTEAQHRHLQIINDIGKMIDLFGRCKLDLINDDGMIASDFLIGHGAQIRQQNTFLLQTDA